MQHYPGHDWLRPLHQRILTAAVAQSGSVLGCSDAEIDSIERQYDVVLPRAYRAVLMAIGRRADGFLDPEEFDFYYDQLRGLTRAVRKAATSGDASNHYPDLPPEAFIIRGRYSEQFELIFCAGGDESPVHYFNTGDGKVVAAYPSVQVWFETLCNDELG